MQEVYSCAKVDRAAMNGAHLILHGKPKKATCSKVFSLHHGCVNGCGKCSAQDFVFISYKCKVDMSKSWTSFKFRDINKVGMRT